MIAETILAASLFATGGVAVNDSPATYYEGVSGCAAYSSTMEQRACVGRVHYAWTGERLEEVSEPVESPVSAPETTMRVITPETDPKPVESRTEVDQWTEPDWCHDWSVNPEDLGYTDWEYVTEDWADEQVAFCFQTL